METSCPLTSLARRDRVFLMALLALALATYLAFPNSNYSYDAMGYARAIDGPFTIQLLHPHHLLFHVMAWAWHKGISVLGVPDSMRSVQLLNSLLGVAGVYFLFRIVFSISRQMNASLLLVASAAFSFSYWYFSTEFEAYIAPLCVTIAASKVLLTDRLSYRSVIVTGLLTAIAVLLHQSHVLFVVPVVAYIWCAEAGVRRLRLSGTFLVVSGSVTLIPYLLAAAQLGHLTSIQTFIRWVTLYAYTIDSYGVKGWSNIPNSLLGLSRVLFASDHARTAMLSSTIDTVTAILVASTAIWIGLASRLIYAERTRLRQAVFSGEHRCVNVFAIAWFGAYGLFAAIVEPKNNEYWLPVLIPSVILGAAVVNWTSEKRMLLAAMASLLLLINFADYFYPNSRPENNENLALAIELHRNGIDDGDIILINRSAINEHYKYLFGTSIRVFSVAQPWRTRGLTQDQVFAVGTELILGSLASGRRVLISGNELSRTPTGKAQHENIARADVSEYYERLTVSWRALFTFRLDGREYVMYEVIAL